MNVGIRQAETTDLHTIELVIKEAFNNVEYSNNSEVLIFNKLYKNKAFVPELSIVAIVENNIVGHIMISKAILATTDKNINILSLAPLSVIPKYQNMGIGTKLIKHAHKVAFDLGFSMVCVIGSDIYYSKFGYEEAKDYNINFPFDMPSKYCRIKFLDDKLNQFKGGEIRYPINF